MIGLLISNSRKKSGTKRLAFHCTAQEMMETALLLQNFMFLNCIITFGTVYYYEFVYHVSIRGRWANRKNSVQTMIFVLKQYDTALISFDLRSEGLDGFVCAILRKSVKYCRLFPLGHEVSARGIIYWRKSRVIPCNREFADKNLSEIATELKRVNNKFCRPFRCMKVSDALRKTAAVNIINKAYSLFSLGISTFISAGESC